MHSACDHSKPCMPMSTSTRPWHHGGDGLPLWLPGGGGGAVTLCGVGPGCGAGHCGLQEDPHILVGATGTGGSAAVL